MRRTAAIIPAQDVLPQKPRSSLLRMLLVLALPVLAEQILHMLVGINDTYLANHLVPDLHGLSPAAVDEARTRMAAAAAAVGTISYIFWLIGLITGAIGTGATAIIARATGARHRSLANSICGQSIAAGAIAGAVLGVLTYVFASPLAHITGLGGAAHDFALSYLRMMAIAIPFIMTMFVANACLRGAGDTLTPAVTFIIVDVVNIAFSWGWTYGLAHLPAWGFEGIAAGTVLAYVLGGLIQVAVLIHGRGGIRLYLHRLSPHWHHLRRLLRIGMPSGLEGMLQWGANGIMVVIINRMDATFVSSAAHNNAVKIESVSYLAGFAFATAAATLVGQSLGMRNTHRAVQSSYLGFLVGGGLMTLMGVLFITLGRYPAMLLSDDPRVIELTRQCLFITGFCQTGFAAAMIFSGALRGAGDTLKVMTINLASVIGLRLTGVLVVALWLKLGLAAIWVVLASELLVRGTLIYLGFLSGAWKRIEV
jgi:putative MATE family efflux protein